MAAHIRIEKPAAEPSGVPAYERACSTHNMPALFTSTNDWTKFYWYTGSNCSNPGGANANAADGTVIASSGQNSLGTFLIWPRALSTKFTGITLLARSNLPRDGLMIFWLFSPRIKCWMVKSWLAGSELANCLSTRSTVVLLFLLLSVFFASDMLVLSRRILSGS